MAKFLNYLSIRDANPLAIRSLGIPILSSAARRFVSGDAPPTSTATGVRNGDVCSYD